MSLMILSDDLLLAFTDLRITCCSTVSAEARLFWSLKFLFFFWRLRFVFCFHGFVWLYVLIANQIMSFIILTGILAGVARKHLSIISFTHLFVYYLFPLFHYLFLNSKFTSSSEIMNMVRPHDTQFLYFTVFHISLRAIVSFVVILCMLILIILCWLLISQLVILLQTRVLM